MKLAAGSCLRSPYPSPTATEVLGLAASCPPCCATPGAAGHWLGRSWKLPAGCGLSSSRITRRSSAGPGFAFMMLHKCRPGWHPRDKVCPRAEPCQELCWRSLAPSRATPPWQGPAQLGTRHSQRGGSHTEPSPGFGPGTWPRLVLTRFAGVPSLLALPCARHRRSLPVPGLSSLNPFTVKSRSRPAAAPPAAAHPGRGGEEGEEGEKAASAARGAQISADPGAGQHLQQRPSRCLVNSLIFSALLQREHKPPGGGKDPRGGPSAGVSGSGALGAAVPELCCAAATASTWTFGLGMGFARGRRRGGRGMREQPGRLPGRL